MGSMFKMAQLYHVIWYERKYDGSMFEMFQLYPVIVQLNKIVED